MAVSSLAGSDFACLSGWPARTPKGRHANATATHAASLKNKPFISLTLPKSSLFAELCHCCRAAFGHLFHGQVLLVRCHRPFMAIRVGELAVAVAPEGVHDRHADLAA